MKKTVTITIEVDMDSKQSKQWENKKDYFEESVSNALDEISSISNTIRNQSGKINTEGSLCTYKMSVKTNK